MVVRRTPPDYRAAQSWPDVPMKARTRRRIAIAIPLILVLTAGIYAARWVYTDRRADEPVEALRAFLEAAHSGDVEAALAMTTGDLYDEEDLLVPDALSDDWEILDLGLETWSAIGERSDVWATIKGPNDTEITAGFDLELIDGDWKVLDPFTTLTVAELPLPYFDVNGVKLTIGTEPSSDRDFALLPGVYQVYENPPELFTYESDPLLALGDKLVNADGTETPYHQSVFDGFTPAESTEPELNERLETYLDECMAGAGGPESFGCPFGVQRGDIDLEEFALGDDRTWEIIEYPQAAASSFGGPVYISPQLQLVTRHAGLARVTVVDEDTGEEAVLECSITTDGLYLTLDDNGDYWIGPNHDPNAPADPGITPWDGDYESWCEMS